MILVSIILTGVLVGVLLDGEGCGLLGVIGGVRGVDGVLAGELDVVASRKFMLYWTGAGQVC